MNAHTVAPTLPRRTPQLVVMIAMAVLLSAASFQSAWAQTAPTLGTAKSFAVLGGQTVTNTGPSTIHGDLGVSPGSAVTGFPPGLVIAPGATHAADAVALQAQSDVTTAYNALAGAASTSNLAGQNLGGKTLVAGVYTFTSSAQLTGSLTLNAAGNANAVFIFQIGSTLTTASNSSVRLINGAQPCNVFWQVGSSATLGTTTSFIGNILALTSIALQTGTTVNGRALARNGAVTLDTNNVTFSGCATPVTGGGDAGPIPGTGPGDGGTPGTPPVAGPGFICVDITPPKFVTQVVPGLYSLITVQDTESGIASIVVIADETHNTTVSIPPFTPGTTAPIVVTATKTTAGESWITLKATDRCGNARKYDPVDFTITAGQTVTYKNIPQEEHFVTIKNEGLQALIITVNGNDARTVWLRPARTRTIKIRKDMVPGFNTIIFEALGFGKAGDGQAVVVVHPE